MISVREHLLKKRMFSFGHCPNEGGGVTSGGCGGAGGGEGGVGGHKGA